MTRDITKYTILHRANIEGLPFDICEAIKAWYPGNEQPGITGTLSFIAPLLEALARETNDAIREAMDELRKEIPRLDDDPRIAVVGDALRESQFDKARAVIDEMQGIKQR